mmetsp:Transcript_1924/g.3419  ORF Transcript_1924/g.3419 Transcript_1924/m.3419 type:complete len:243 (+) Transcript_1924:134-862(+)
MVQQEESLENIESIEASGEATPLSSEKVSSNAIKEPFLDTNGDEKTSESFPQGFIIRGKIFNPSPKEIDLYGNIQLHHSVSHNCPNINRVKGLLEEFPDGAQQKNQFGRIPLHYVLDRAKISLKAAKLLLKAYPAGVTIEDNEGNTPYDLAIHWHHSKRILRLLLKYDRYQDLEMWRRLEYGYLYNICYCLCCWYGTPQSLNSDGGDGVDDGGNGDSSSEKLLEGQNSFQGNPQNTIIPFSS